MRHRRSLHLVVFCFSTVFVLVLRHGADANISLSTDYSLDTYGLEKRENALQRFAIAFLTTADHVRFKRLFLGCKSLSARSLILVVQDRRGRIERFSRHNSPIETEQSDD